MWIHRQHLAHKCPPHPSLALAFSQDSWRTSTGRCSGNPSPGMAHSPLHGCPEQSPLPLWTTWPCRHPHQSSWPTSKRQAASGAVIYPAMQHYGGGHPLHLPNGIRTLSCHGTGSQSPGAGALHDLWAALCSANPRCGALGEYVGTWTIALSKEVISNCRQG